MTHSRPRSTAAAEARLRTATWARATDPRWRGVSRPYTAADVVRLRGSVPVEHSLARTAPSGCGRLLHTEDYINALGALTGGQAVEMVKAGLQAIYLSGWQVAADANLSEQVYPDQSLYAANSVPAVVRRINNALRRADQIEWAESERHGRPNGTAALDGADRRRRRGRLRRRPQRLRADEGHDRGRARPASTSRTSCPRRRSVATWAARSWCRPPSTSAPWPPPVWPPTSATCRRLVVARTDSLGRHPADQRRRRAGPAVLHRRALPRGLLLRAAGHGHRRRPRPGLRPVRRSDLVRDLDARPRRGPDLFAERIKAEYPDQMLAYNCSPSFNWKKHLDDQTIARFQKELGAMGYTFQFVTLAGWHALNESTFALARGYAERGMSAYVELQQREFALEEDGYTATRHQREVGAGYFDDVMTTLSGGTASTLALAGSTEEAQFRAINRSYRCLGDE